MTATIHPSANPVIPAFPCFPARPADGGQLQHAAPKIGNWFCEPKYNGWRALVHIATGAMFNRHGEMLSISHEFQPALRILRATLDAEAFKWADCEALERRHGIGRGSLIVLDVIPEMPFLKTSTYLERRDWLEPVLYAPDMMSRRISEDQVYLSPKSTQIETTYQLAAEANRDLNCEFYEGIVAKKANSLYPFQLRNPKLTTPAWIKHRWHF